MIHEAPDGTGCHRPPVWDTTSVSHSSLPYSVTLRPGSYCCLQKKQNRSTEKLAPVTKRDLLATYAPWSVDGARQRKTFTAAVCWWISQ